jgi:hypothetical protein
MGLSYHSNGGFSPKMHGRESPGDMTQRQICATIWLSVCRVTVAKMRG